MNSTEKKENEKEKQKRKQEYFANRNKKKRFTKPRLPKKQKVIKPNRLQQKNKRH